ncbi:MAG: hypothetical protein JST00_34665 [Deltaproteobacteria bacterium]|nr:hypothetical protein [Deltaproteobacteria bacterium]
MAVVVSAYDVVVRVDALPDGPSVFARTVPNATFCTDGHLARASFMNADDREHFIARLEGIAPEAMARVEKRLSTVDAPWLERGTYAGVDAVWARDASPEPLVVPVTWRPAELVFGTWEEMREHLEYEGFEDGVEVYRDRRTGRKVYTGRTTPQVDPATAEKIAKARQDAHVLLAPLLSKVLARKALGFFEKRTVKKAAAIYEHILTLMPTEAASLWMLGLIARAFEEHGVALDRFRRAYDANPAAKDIGREYAGQCFINGEAAEGLRISRLLHSRFPEDVGLQSNLALALLIGGDLNEAMSVAQSAHEREPNDPITKNLLDYIGKVRDGRVARPKRLPGT